MEYFIIPTIALIASALTFFSGFGLGTILLPAFGLFFPIEIAIALTAIVHFLNNIFKLGLVFKNIDKKVVLGFGVPALLFSFLGAKTLQLLDFPYNFIKYQISENVFETNIVKITIAVVLPFFAFFELIPKLKNLQFNKKYLVLGGMLSGFFGGLSGHQGALRSAFLTKVGLSKEAFIATGVSIACLIDISRLSVYSNQITQYQNQIDINLILVATISAFIGVYFGTKLVKKITISTIQNIVAVMLILFAVLLGMGIV
ncbi:MAG: sulfite exporter TauE/SafE family protein [Flavobacterium sp.]